MFAFATTPTALIGDRFPALAPFATISAVRKRGTPPRVPIAIASGMSSATLEIAPGPIDDSTKALTKNTIGIARALPRAIRTARFASRSSVPFVSASANSSDTPASVRKSDAGKPAIT